MSSFEELVPINFKDNHFSYQYISSILSYKQMGKTTALIVDYLDPEYFLFFSHIKIILTRNGSPLSHLSILAREYGLPIIRCNFSKKIPTYGKIEIDKISNKVTFIPN